jgi:Aminoglycoside-2''-adenylyltransferase
VHFVNEDEQLAAMSRLDELFLRHGVEYWLFGGWAVDFHAGSVTRPHDDLDLAVRSEDETRVRELLMRDGWSRAPEGGEEGYTVWARGDVRLEVAFADRGEWPPGSFAHDVAELRGVRARLVSLASLKEDKAEVRGDPQVAAKDRIDSRTLERIRR